MYVQLSKKLFLVTLVFGAVICAFLVVQLKCTNRTKVRGHVGVASNRALSRLVHKGAFYILTNYAKADRAFGYNDSVTFAAPADHRFLDNLVPLVDRWRGPISVAVYAPGYDFDTAVETIACLRRNHGTIKEFVTFHLFFEEAHLPLRITKLNDLNVTCDQDPVTTTLNPKELAEDGDEDYEDTYKFNNHLLFPINVARNIAKDESYTHFILVSDIELLPSRNFIMDFLSLIKRRPELYSGIRHVFVLPVFEIPEGETVPETKNQLLDMYRDKRAFLFHLKLCRMCHEVPKFKKWIATNETAELDLFANARRQGAYRFWEPFYVGTHQDPNFDERVTWEGQNNKMVQAYLMCLLNYNYVVLNNAFFVHKPGIKKGKKQLEKHAGVVARTRKMLKQELLPEYEALYGKNKACHLF